MKEEEHAMLQQQGQGYNEDAPRQVVLLEDITLVIDVALIAALCGTVQLLRRRAITIATFTHGLSVPFLVVVLGHCVERHLLGIDRVGDLVYRRPGRGSFADWSSAGLLSAAVVAALVARFWNCRGVGVDCVVGDAAPIHYRCKLLRLRFFGPVFAATMAFAYVCICARLNALLGGSVLHPEEGGYALAVLASPTLVSALFVSGSVSVWLYSVLVDAQGEGTDDLLGGGRGCSLRHGKCAGRTGGGCSGGDASNAWEPRSSSTSSNGGVGGRGTRGGGGGHGSRNSSGVDGLPCHAEGGAEAEAGKIAGGMAGPAHALDPPFFPLSPLNVRSKGEEPGIFSSSLIQAARGGLEVQQLDASDPASDPACNNRIDSPRAAAAPIGEGLLQAAGENYERAGGTCSYSCWGNVSSSEGPSYRRVGLGPAGASQLALGGVASWATEGAATAAGMRLLPVPSAMTPRGRNEFLDGSEVWQGGGGTGGTGLGPGRQQLRRRRGRPQERRRQRGGGDERGGNVMTASANGWTSSSGSASSSKPGSSEDDFPGSGGGGSGSGSGGGIQRLSGLSGNLSAVPSTRPSLGTISYASSGVGGGGGRGIRIPSFPSSGFPADGGASLTGDGQSLESLDRQGLRSREVLPYFPVGSAPKSSTIASLTSSSSKSSSSVSSGRRGINVSGRVGRSDSDSSPRGRDREGRRGGGGGWVATSGIRCGSGESSRGKSSTTTAPCAATARNRVKGGGGDGGSSKSGGGGGGGGDWGVEFLGDPETGAGGGATRLRRREGWIV